MGSKPMPYKSKAQERKLNLMAKQGKISQKVVDEFNAASKGLKLPERVEKKAKSKKGK